MIATAIRKGTLIPAGCEICGEPGKAHHENYSKPMEVKWLCDRHHIEEHKRLGWGYPNWNVPKKESAQ